MRLNYAPIASEAKRRDDPPKHFEKEIDPWMHGNIIRRSAFSLYGLEAQGRPQNLASALCWSRVSLDGEFRPNEWKIHMAQVSEQLADVSERTRCADGRVLNMHVAIFVTVVAIVVGVAAPTCANDRPSDPFGNYTVEMNEEAYLFGIWEYLRDQVLLDRAHFHQCIESNNKSNNTDCASVSTLMKIVEEARQNQGKALLGHLNRSINLMIKA